jgi:hypothetical protein
LPGPAFDCTLPSCATRIAGITDMNHHIQLVC